MDWKFMGSWSQCFIGLCLSPAVFLASNHFICIEKTLVYWKSKIIQLLFKYYLWNKSQLLLLFPAWCFQKVWNNNALLLIFSPRSEHSKSDPHLLYVCLMAYIDCCYIDWVIFLYMTDLSYNKLIVEKKKYLQKRIFKNLVEDIILYQPARSLSFAHDMSQSQSHQSNIVEHSALKLK